MADGPHAVSVQPQGSGTRTLPAFTDEAMKGPVSVTANQPSSWHSAQAGADMVIISHGDFIDKLAPLVALRQSQLLKVAVVNVVDLYDEFNYGVKSPYALRTFLSTANTVWTKKPRWVLLVGGATFDPRNYLSLPENESDSTAAADFLAAFNSGQGLVNYVGHGSVEVWQQNMFTSAVAGTVANGPKTPLVLSMTCLNGYFLASTTFSLAEALMQGPGGAVGVWASSGLTEAASQATLNQAMIQALYGGGSITVGEAAVAAKKAVSDMDVRRTWILFGDPAMRVR